MKRQIFSRRNAEKGTKLHSKSYMPCARYSSFEMKFSLVILAATAATASAARFRSRNNAHSTMQDASSSGDWNIYLDGKTPINIPRVVMDAPPAYLLWRYDMKKNGIKVENGYVRMPTQTKLQASFARNFVDVGESQTGFSNLVWQMNPVSIVTPYPKLVAAEKYHVMSHDGPWDTSAADSISNTLATPSAANTAMFGIRVESVVANFMATDLGNQLTWSGQDQANLDEIRKYAALDGKAAGVVQKLTSHMRSELSAGAQRAAVAAATTHPKSSENLCLHLEETPEISIFDGYYQAPLRKNLVALRGQGTLAPMRTFGLFAGTLVFDVSVDGEHLEAYFVATQHLNLNMFKPKGTLYVGPANGVDSPVSASDGRYANPYEENSDLVKSIAHLTYKFMNAIPKQYGLLQASQGSICSANTRQHLAKTMRAPAAEINSLVRGGLLEWESKNFLGNFLGDFEDDVEGYAQDAAKDVNKVVHSASNVVNEELSEVVNSASNVVNSALSGVKAIGSDVLNWGESTVQDLVQHVSSLIDALKKTPQVLQSSANTILNALKNLVKWVSNKRNKRSADANRVWATGAYALMVATNMPKSVQCGASFIGAVPPFANSFETLEFAVWGHFIVETPPSFTGEATTATFWNDGIIV